MAINERADYAMRVAIEMGYSVSQAAALVGHMNQESGIRPVGAVGDGGTAFGAMQWRGDRFTRLQAFRGSNGERWNDPDWKKALKTQVQFADHELKTTESAAGKRFFAASNVLEATKALNGFERPRGWYGWGANDANPATVDGWSNRISYAQKAEQYAKQLGLVDGLSQWQQALKSSPDHVTRELEALGTEEAKKHLATLKSLSVVTKDYDAALNKAVSYVSKSSKDVLDKAGIEANSNSYSLGELVGGQAAVKILQVKDKATTTMGQLVKDGVITKSMLDNYAKTLTPELKKEAGLSEKEQKNPEEMTVEHFIGSISAVQLQRKRAAEETARNRLTSPGNRSLLDQMMGANMGIEDFLGMLILLFIMDAMGIDAEKFLGGRIAGDGYIGNGRNGYSTNSGASETPFDPAKIGNYDPNNKFANRTYTDVNTVPYLKLPESAENKNGWTAYAVSTEAGVYNGPMAKGMIAFRSPEGKEYRFAFVSGGGSGDESVRGGPAPGLNNYKSSGLGAGVNAVYQLGNLEVGDRGNAFTGDNGQNFFIHTPSNAQSAFGRSEIGIHPDGGNYGTAGCFGIDPTKTAEFIAMWNSIPPDQRPKEMKILDPKILQDSTQHIAKNVQRDPANATLFSPSSNASNALDKATKIGDELKRNSGVSRDGNNDKNTGIPMGLPPKPPVARAIHP
jgi:hypothetical protein